MEKSTEIIVGTASTLEIAAKAIAEHTDRPYHFIANSDETELSLLHTFQQKDDPHPVIVQTETAVSGTSGLKRVRGLAYLYAVSFSTPVDSETAQTDTRMEMNE